MADEFIDFNRLVVEIESRAIKGLNKTLGYTHAQAQKHAPVRAIFKRTRRGDETARIKTRAVTSRGIMAAYRRQPFGEAEMLNQKAMRGPNRRISPPKSLDLATARKLYKVGKRDALDQAADLINGGQRIGGTNSEDPVFRVGRVTITGSRQVAGGKLVPTTILRQVRGGKVEVRPAPLDKRGDPVAVGELRLSSRGRYEVKTGRAMIRRAGEDQIGGALKNSIVKVPATLTSREGDIIWGSVRAGNDEVDYARWQEFGTGHNRAHPFLRPALYESRERFKTNVENALQNIRTRGR